MSRMASLSLDLDNLWSYLKTHGDPGWEDYPTYLDRIVDVVLPMLADRDLTITFFIVGADAARSENARALRAIADAGHEIGNHSFHHEPWLHLYSRERLTEEFQRTEAALEAATGHRPIGFRGPGFSLSHDTLDVLAERGYQYDCSTLPMYLGPLARQYYFWSARLSAEEREQRRFLFGRFSDGNRPVRAYRWTFDPPLLEIPVTTMPGLKLPFHVSYLLYASLVLPALGRAYFATALRACDLGRVEPSLLLHPLDFVGGDEVPELRFFPAMNRPGHQKREWVARFLDMSRERYDVVPMRNHAAALTAKTLPLRQPDFATE